MSVKLLTEQCLKLPSLKEAAQARLRQHLSKCHIVVNHVSRLIYGLNLNLLPYSLYTSSEDSGETVCLRGQVRLFTARLCDKYCVNISGAGVIKLK